METFGEYREIVEFLRILDAAGRPKNMSDQRKRELYERERKVYVSTIANMVDADGFGPTIRVSTEPIAFL